MMSVAMATGFVGVTDTHTDRHTDRQTYIQTGSFLVYVKTFSHVKMTECKNERPAAFRDFIRKTNSVGLVVRTL